MSLIISEILLQNLAWTILEFQTFRRYHRIGNIQGIVTDLITFFFIVPIITCFINCG